ncbi:thioredoxin family protein [Candidatus Leptofilum sp.]|uniref:thioredoxin family protein n=1 Tax=Candidatus Leptofilum sp. TaxID=3241576 RepID=UPI003B5A27C8
MIERLIITTILILLGTSAYATFKRRHVRVLGDLETVVSSSSTALSSSAQAMSQTPTILYFASDSCAACPSQARYLEQLLGKWEDGLMIQKIDAELEPETAVKYGVFTLPTTILIDQQGDVREINYGLTHTQKLTQQVASLA